MADRAHGVRNTPQTHLHRQRLEDVHRAGGVASVAEGTMALDDSPAAGSAPTYRRSTTPSPYGTCSATDPASANTSTTMLTPTSTLCPAVRTATRRPRISCRCWTSRCCRARRRLRVQQRRLRAARPARSTGVRRPVSGSGARAGAAPSRPAAHRLPALRRTARLGRPATCTSTACAPTSSTYRSRAARTAAPTPPSATPGSSGWRWQQV